MSDTTSPSNIDHIVLVASDLESGSKYVHSLLNVWPLRGGKHPLWGTHNALVSIGPSTYLEIIAPDPRVSAPANGRLFGDLIRDQPYIVTWALRTNSIENLRDKAVNAGIHLGQIEAGNRQTGDGQSLSWLLTDPHALPFQGLVPFLIDWTDTPHPSCTNPNAGRLTDFELFHPSPLPVTDALDVLGADIRVTAGPVQIVATVETANGSVVFS